MLGTIRAFEREVHSVSSETRSTPDCPLPRSSQTRNIVLYAINWGLIYLASPVGYVGLLQATLVNKLGYDNTWANLPSAIYLGTTPLSVLVVCFFTQPWMLKPLLITS